MIVEPYSDKYFLDVVSLVKNFHKEAVSEYLDAFDPDSVIDTIKSQTQDNSRSFLLIEDNRCQGILFGMCFRSMINKKLIFQEVIWYVNENYRKHGVKLLKHAENMLKSDGISIIIMAVLENSKTEKLKKFYERLGYKPMETHFVRDL